jgi:hypothetical protein
MKVKSIKHSPVDLRRILPGSWEMTKVEFKLENIDLSDVKWKKEKNMRILLTDLTVKIDQGKDGVLVYLFKRGWCTDLASVPWFFRSQVDNDDRNIIIAALVHDANFGGHFLSFDKSNSLFRNMIVKGGGSWWFAFKAYWGVQNHFGQKAYNRSDDEIEQHNKYVSFFWGDK